MSEQEPIIEKKFEKFYNENYKKFLLIPLFLLVLSLGYLGYFYSKNNDFILKDSSLSGGTTITLNIGALPENFESSLKAKNLDISFRKLTDLITGETASYIIESSLSPEEIKPAIEEELGYKLTEENSNIEFTGSSLSQSFYKQLIMSLLISFILMSIVIFILFKIFIPSIAVILSAFSDIVMPLALIDFLGIKLSAAGIAAFLMLIGYSVDTDILLTTRVLKQGGARLNKRIFGAFKTGIFMTLTALAAILPAFLIVSGLPDSFRQIFFILALGLFADIVNTWITNTSIIKWYCTRKGIK